MNSMTGYGRGESEKDGCKVTVELRSVNHRFLDLSIKLPRCFLFAEDFVRKYLGTRFARGHIDVYLNYENVRAGSTGLAINLPVVGAYIDMANELNARFGVANDLTASAIIRLPDALTQSSEDVAQDELLELTSAALTAACDSLVVVRAKEGAKLTEDLSIKIDLIAKLTSEAEQLAPTVVADYKERLSKRIREALADVTYDEARFLNEIAFFTDKACIDEELTRMKAHIVAARRYLTDVTPMGKSFDCLVQEMNREANTMGSKANFAALQRVVVALKTEIEKVREQVQNIE